MANPPFDRKSLAYAARRIARGIQLEARFNAPKLSNGKNGRYVALMTVNPSTRGLTGLTFSYSRDGSKYLVLHGGGTDELRRIAREIRDIFLLSLAWKELKDRDPDPHYIIDHLGKVTVRSSDRK